MADLLLDVQSAPVTPSTGQAVIFVDSTSKRLAMKDDTGNIKSLSVTNFSTALQSPLAATLTYLTGSALAIPTGKMQIGSMFRWKWSMTKTAAGVALSTIDVRIGTNGTTADTARLTFTKPAGTAVVDEAWCELVMTVRGPLSASGIVVGTFNMTHNLQITGHAVIPCVVVTVVSSAFDVTVANLIVGLTITTGAADAITIQHVQSEVINV